MILQVERLLLEGRILLAQLAVGSLAILGEAFELLLRLGVLLLLAFVFGLARVEQLLQLALHAKPVLGIREGATQVNDPEFRLGTR